MTFHISTPETKTKILVSISVKCFSDLRQHGAQQVLEREYAGLVTDTEAGYDFSLIVDLENLPETDGMSPLDTSWLDKKLIDIPR